jgi:hypothetical protein
MNFTLPDPADIFTYIETAARLPAKQRPGSATATNMANTWLQASEITIKPEHPGGYEVDQSVAASVRPKATRSLKVRWTPAQAQTW